MRGSGAASALALAVLLLAGCRPAQQPVVVAYVSVDQPHAEPVLKAFEQASGIRVAAVYDVEATKAVGLANRVLAEAERPQADVWWNGEFVQTLRLQEAGALEPYASHLADQRPPEMRDPDGHWTGIAPRCRVWIARRGLAVPRELGLADLPDLDLPADRIVVSKPLFGTSCSQAAAFYALLGPAKAKSLYQALLDKGVRFAEGNATVRDLVVAGDADLGLTDSDDALGALRKGAAVDVWPAEQGGLGTLVMCGTAGLVRGGPHPEPARALLDYLLGAEAEAELIRNGFGQWPIVDPSVQSELQLGDMQVMAVTPADVVDHLDRAAAELRELFLQ
jgi:iron(III) transport system substrate-binding protein